MNGLLSARCQNLQEDIDIEKLPPRPGSDMQLTLLPNLGTSDTPLNRLLRAFHSKTYISSNYASSQKIILKRKKYLESLCTLPLPLKQQKEDNSQLHLRL